MVQVQCVHCLCWFDSLAPKCPCRIAKGDMIEYTAENEVRVIIYAREITADRITDGNVSCPRKLVTRVVHTAEYLARKQP